MLPKIMESKLILINYGFNNFSNKKLNKKINKRSLKLKF